MKDIKTIHSEFYDLEYFLSMEYRYYSGAHNSRIKNILNCIGDVKNLKGLDIGCGGGYFVNTLNEMGAQVMGIDYSSSAIQFGKSRFPHLNLKIQSVYNLSNFDDNSFDFVTLIDVIEHINNHDQIMSEIFRLLKPGGALIISTDFGDSYWKKSIISRIIWFTNCFSKNGRAYRLIKKVESKRKRIKNYHKSHICEFTSEKLKSLLIKNGFIQKKHFVYPMVGVFIRDVFLKFLPKRIRGDHQCVVAEKKST